MGKWEVVAEKRKVELSYDANVFDIDYHRHSDKFIIKRIDGKCVIDICDIIDGDIGFIFQVYDEKKWPYFIISQLQDDRYHPGNKESVLHYYQYSGDHLIRRNTRTIEYLNACYTCINQKSYLLYDWDHSDSNKYCIYNLDKESEHFTKVEFGEERMGDLVIVHQERTVTHKPTYRNFVKDYIIYGIDPNTFEAVTPIWSQLQGRWIPLLTEKEIEDLSKDKEFTTPTKYLLENEVDKYISKSTDQYSPRTFKSIDSILIDSVSQGTARTRKDK